MKKRILVFGEICKELTLNGSGSINDLVMRAENFENIPGGNGANVSAALACLGYDTVLCSNAGMDADGKSLVKYLRDLRFDNGSLNVSNVLLKPNCCTPVHVSVNMPDGERKIICHSLDYGISGQDVEDAFSCYPDSVVVTDSVTAAGLRELKQQVDDRDTTLYIMGAESAERLSTVEKCRVLSLTDEETRKITAIQLSNQQNCMRACMALEKIVKADYIILRMKTGCFIYDGTFYTFKTSFELPDNDIIDADPIFIASFIRAFEKSEGDVQYACEYGIATVAVYVTSGKTDVPTDAKIRAFADRNGVKL